jgi:exo-beta-1,3-glucanase (GH17 family)
MELVPGIAAEFGLKVTLGVWLDTDLDRDGNHDLVADPDDLRNLDKRITRNDAEIRTAIKLARSYNNINAIVVGNETTLRRSLVEAAQADEAQKAFDKREANGQRKYPDFKTALAGTRDTWNEALRLQAAKTGRPIDYVKAEWNVGELMKILQRVKRQSPVPVTTGETWDIWVEYPKLATAVDFIAAHILPYWDHVPYTQAVDHSLGVYYKLRAAHPGKRIVIAEFGWPSGGYNRGVAEPGRLKQATVLRQFINRADALGIDYNVI